MLKCALKLVRNKEYYLTVLASEKCVVSLVNKALLIDSFIMAAPTIGVLCIASELRRMVPAG